MDQSPLPTLRDATAEANANAWLKGDYDPATKKEVEELLQNFPEEALDAFYKNLSFGTGGMRGIMGVGSNRMNGYTVRAATQGLANYLISQNSEGAPLSVFIGYDSRKNSRFFAEESAKVLAGNGIRAYLCSDLRPTPLVSFGTRWLHCSAAIMVTASHNPKEYNGYKVYWSDGGQVLPPHDKKIVEDANAILTPSQVKSTETLDSALIEIVGDDVDDAYLKALQNLSLLPDLTKTHGKELKIVYSSLHGTGITLAPRALRLRGFLSLQFVEKQIIPDGEFPTAPYPNPEEKEALNLGIEALERTGSDLFIATDPDADRMGVVVAHQGEASILTGNQIACILLHHIITSLQEKNALPEHPACVKSIVTSDLFRAIAESSGAECFEVLPGFKYIAEKIRNWEANGNTPQFLFGAEESYGYLYGTIARDKDAIEASVLIAEAALKAKLEGKTLIDLLDEIYAVYGIYAEELLSVPYEEGKEGADKMKSAMAKLRSAPPTLIGDHVVLQIEDYLTQEALNLLTQEKTALSLPKSDFLLFRLESGSRVMIRPSGTEPKIKIYCGYSQKKYDTLEQGKEQAKQEAENLLNAAKALL